MEDDLKYQGFVNEAGNFDGPGISLSNDELFEGLFVNGKREKGVLSTYAGETYMGGFKNGRAHGHGIKTLKDNTKLEGFFTDGKLQGKGTILVGDINVATQLFPLWTHNDQKYSMISCCFKNSVPIGLGYVFYKPGYGGGYIQEKK